jgi:multiple sugar transport system permease protein
VAFFGNKSAAFAFNGEWEVTTFQTQKLPFGMTTIPTILGKPIWMPLSRATIAAIGIFTFVIAWNSFIWPFVITSAEQRMTIPVGISTVYAQYGALYAQQMALALLGALPLLVVFLLFQRQIVQGIANTGLKG